jgi:tRNA dimethylallyltransferase
MKIILLGPTAVGKTELSLQLSEALHAAIISVDARQCYKYLDIGTAKPTDEQLKLAPHYNISVLEPDEADNPVAFLKRLEGWDHELEHYPHQIFTGGSTLYLQSLIRPMDDMPESDPDNLRKLHKRIESEGIESLYKQLKRVDPDYTERMDGMNRQRIIRALDVWMQSGKPFSHFHSNDKIKPKPDTLVFGLKRDRQKLVKRIHLRVDQMMETGLIGEVKQILGMGYTGEEQSLQTVGYREILDLFNGVYQNEETAAERIKVHTRRYAKRQMTWFRRWPFIEWLDLDTLSTSGAFELILKKVATKSNKG